MYEKPKKILEELTARKMELTEQIVNGQNLDYLAMEKQYLEIVIQGKQGSGKTTTFNTINESLKKAGFTIIPLHPIPSLGMEDRALACTGNTIINIFTEQKEVTHG